MASSTGSYPYLEFARAHDVDYGLVLKAVDDIELRRRLPPNIHLSLTEVVNQERARQREELEKHLETLRGSS